MRGGDENGLIWQTPVKEPAEPKRARVGWVRSMERQEWTDTFLEMCRPIGSEKLRFEEDEWNWDLSSAVGIDVELYRNFFLVCCKRFLDRRRIAFEISERCTSDLEPLRRILEGNCIITFNGATYDLPLIYMAMRGASLAELKAASDRIIYTGSRAWDVEREFGVRVPREVNHIDLMEPNPSVRQGLKILAARLHVRHLVDLPFDPEAALTPEQMSHVTLYCFNDIDSTELLFGALRPALELRRALGREHGVDLRSKSDPQVGEAIVKKRVEGESGRRLGRQEARVERSFTYAPPPFISFQGEKLRSVLEQLRHASFSIDHADKVVVPEFLRNLEVTVGAATYAMGIGGLHSQESHRAVHADEDRSLIDIDVRSQYPEIIVKLGLYPVATGPAFLDIYDRLIRERLAAKAAGEKVKAESGKIIVNGVFGKLGSPYSVLYAPRLMLAVTITGQLSLLMLIERCEAAGIAVVSGNTDGVVLHCPRSLEPEADAIIKRWEAETGFEIERTRYRSIYNASVNTYIAVREDGKVKRKGYIADPWREGDVRGQLSKNPQMTVCSEAIVRYILDGTPLEETIRGCADPRSFVTVIKVTGGATWRDHLLGRAVRYYWSVEGDEILYVKSGNRVPKTEGARPLMELTDELPPYIDYDRYVAEARALAVDLAVIEKQEGWGS